ncbi:hypothetical protein L345_14524, partial [Ophiophagus hannah]
MEQLNNSFPSIRDSQKMKQGPETLEGGAGSVLEEPCETLCYPSAAEVAEAEVAQEELRRSARPKELTAWQTAPAEPAVQRGLEPAMVVPALLGALRQPGMGAAYEWRPPRSLEAGEFQEWRLQLSRSQLLAGLPKKFELLSVGPTVQTSPHVIQPGWVLLQPIFHFLGLGGTAVQSE